MATVYGTLADADQYFTDRGGASVYPAWFGASTTEKQFAHVRATDFIDFWYEVRMQGRRAEEGQTRAQPRASQYLSGYLLDETKVPLNVQQATWEAARLILDGHELLPDSLDYSQGGEIVGETKKAGLVSKSVQYQPETQTNIREWRTVDALMQPILLGGGGSVPVQVVHT